MNQGNYPEALKNYFASLKIYEELKDKKGIAMSYNNIGIIYRNQGNYPEALKNYFASLKIFEEIGDKDGIARCFINLGTLYIKLHKNPESQDYLNKALVLSKEIGSKDDIKLSYGGLADLDSAIGNFQNQITHYKLYIIYRDSIDNEETRKKTMRAEMNYEYEKREIATKAAQEKKDALAAAEKKREKVIRYSVIGGLVLALVFLVFVYRSLRVTRRQKRIIETQRDTVTHQKEEIEAQRDIVTQQKQHIEHIHEELTDSIRYAERIQNAVLPGEQYIMEILGMGEWASERMGESENIRQEAAAG
ncbi:MAG: tetratricopeptide repeat protein, partial [Bacteroidetes bacterium]|nr:tetratricopeptide repeat protein [Bacteroidota bacterium]